MSEGTFINPETKEEMRSYQMGEYIIDIPIDLENQIFINNMQMETSSQSKMSHLNTAPSTWAKPQSGHSKYYTYNSINN